MSSLVLLCTSLSSIVLWCPPLSSSVLVYWPVSGVKTIMTKNFGVASCENTSERQTSVPQHAPTHPHLSPSQLKYEKIDLVKKAPVECVTSSKVLCWPATDSPHLFSCCVREPCLFWAPIDRMDKWWGWGVALKHKGPYLCVRRGALHTHVQ